MGKQIAKPKRSIGTQLSHTHVTKMFPFHLYNRFLADGTVFKGYTFSHVDWLFHGVRLFTVHNFPWDRRCRSLSSTGRRWSLDASKTGESTKRPWVEVVGLIASSWRGGKKSKKIGKKENFFARCALHHPYPRVFSTFPVLLASRDQDRCSFNSTINIYDLTEKFGTVNSLPRWLITIFTVVAYEFLQMCLT